MNEPQIPDITPMASFPTPEDWWDFKRYEYERRGIRMPRREWLDGWSCVLRYRLAKWMERFGW